MKKAISILAIMALLIGMFAGCGGSETEVASSDGDAAGSSDGGESSTTNITGGVEGTSEDETLTIAIAAEPASMLLGKTLATTSEANDLIQETLVNWDVETGEILPNLAESWEWIDDTHFRLKLREGVYFQDGEELTAETVLANAQFYFDITHSTASVYDYEAWYAEDDYNVVCATIGVYVLGVDRLAMEPLIFSKAALEAQGGADNTDIVPSVPFGSGKYKFVEWKTAQYIMLERYDDYWNQDDLPYFKYIKFVFIADTAARGMAVESGDADVAALMPLSSATAYDNHPDVVPHYIDTKQAGLVFLNQTNPDVEDNPLADVRVREAIYRLVDVDAINQMGMNGMGTVLETSISPASIIYDPPPEDWDRSVDIERAKELLAEAGYPDGLTISTIWRSVNGQYAEVVQECLRLGGIELELEMVEVSVAATLHRSGQYLMDWTMLSALNYTENIRLMDGRLTHAQVVGGIGNRDEAFNEIADRCYNAIDMDERMEAYAEAQAYMRDNYYVVGCATTIRCEVMRAGLTTPVVTGRAGSHVDYATVRPVAS